MTVPLVSYERLVYKVFPLVGDKISCHREQPGRKGERIKSRRARWVKWVISGSWNYAPMVYTRDHQTLLFYNGPDGEGLGFVVIRGPLDSTAVSQQPQAICKLARVAEFH